VAKSAYGTGRMPEIVVKDITVDKGSKDKRNLVLKHIFDGHKLDETLAKQCLLKIRECLWREGDVILLSAEREKNGKMKKVKYICSGKRVETVYSDPVQQNPA